MLTRTIAKCSQWRETQRENTDFPKGPFDNGSFSCFLLSSVTGSQSRNIFLNKI